MEARRKTICNNNDDSKAGHWVSNIRDDGGPLEGGSSYRIKWEPDYTSPNYSVIYRELSSSTNTLHNTILPVNLSILRIVAR